MKATCLAGPTRSSIVRLWMPWLSSVFALSLTAAEVPRLLPFQARLLDANGKAIPEGATVIQFQLFAEPNGGNPVWAGELHRVTVNGGLVNVVLGSKNPLPVNFPGDDTRPLFGTTLYLQATPDANGDGKITSPEDPPLRPRQAVLPVIFAAEAQRARSAAVADDAAKLGGRDWSVVFGAELPAFGRIPRSALSASAQVPIGALLPFEETQTPEGYSPTNFELSEPDKIVTRAKFSSTRTITATAVLGSRLFAIGRPSSDRVGLTEEYDLEKNQWRVLGDWPRPRGNALALAVGGKILVIGGSPTGVLSGPSSAWVDILDPDSGTWTTGPDLPIATHSAGGAVIGDTAFVFGGYSNFDINGWTMQPISSAQSFSASTRKWRSDRKPLPIATQSFACIAHNGRIHVVGGLELYLVGPVQSAHMAYNPEADTWETLADSPIAGSLRAGPNKANGFVALASGLMLEYDRVHDSWATRTSLLVPAYAQNQWVVGDRLLFQEGGYPVPSDRLREFLPGRRARFWRQQP